MSWRADYQPNSSSGDSLLSKFVNVCRLHQFTSLVLHQRPARVGVVNGAALAVAGAVTVGAALVATHVLGHRTLPRHCNKYMYQHALCIKSVVNALYS